MGSNVLAWSAFLVRHEQCLVIAAERVRTVFIGKYFGDLIRRVGFAVHREPADIDFLIQIIAVRRRIQIIGWNSGGRCTERNLIGVTH